MPASVREHLEASVFRGSLGCKALSAEAFGKVRPSRTHEEADLRVVRSIPHQKLMALSDPSLNPFQEPGLRPCSTELPEMFSTPPRPGEL